MLITHTDRPFVTVNLSCHSEDIHHLPRALKSIRKQTLGEEQIQLLIAYDGDPVDDGKEEFITESCKEYRGLIFLLGDKKKTGYYTTPRNRALNFPLNVGFYQAYLDVDNEWEPSHLEGLLQALRAPNDRWGFAHFAYSRRKYVIDDTVPEELRKDLPEGDSPLVEWTDANITKLCQSPMQNFVDTGDLLIGRSAMFALAERTGFPWDANARRYGDWELMTRLAKKAFRGLAVDQVTNIYHWTGDNLQMTRKSEIVALTQEEYDAAVRAGLLKS